MINPVSIRQLTAVELQGKRILLRLDLNVPIKEGKVTNNYRLEKAKPTIDYLRERGAKILILSHRGEKEGSLSAVVDYYRQFFPVGFITHYQNFSQFAEQPEQVVLLENLRQGPEEESNDQTLAQNLATVADLYVNEAFPVSHRAHASVSVLPLLLPSYAGLNFIAEVENLSTVLNPDKPLLVILGGAKFDTKVPLIKRFLELADNIFIGGALACSWLKAEGKEVGTSLVDDDLEIIKPFLGEAKIKLPTEVVIQSESGEVSTVAAMSVPQTAKIVDIGISSLQNLQTELQAAHTILWNGPLGYFEKGFSAATEEVAKILAWLPAKTIVGGGDTVAAIEKLGLMDKFTFVSTAGGAMLDFLAQGTLPGIEALLESQKKFKII